MYICILVYLNIGFYAHTHICNLYICTYVQIQRSPVQLSPVQSIPMCSLGFVVVASFFHFALSGGGFLPLLGGPNFAP